MLATIKASDPSDRGALQQSGTDLRQQTRS